MVSEAPSVSQRSATPESAGEPEGGRAGRFEKPMPFEQPVPLRLSVSRGQLGLELSQSHPVGPLDVDEFVVALTGLRYPVDLSKGVKQFRSRRGQLERVCLSVDPERLGAWLGHRLELQAPTVDDVRVWPLAAADAKSQSPGIGVGLLGDDYALAFELRWVTGDGLSWVLARARGMGVALSPWALVLRAAAQLFGHGVGIERRGRVLLVRGALHALAREVLPALGCRLPAARDLPLTNFEVVDGRLRLTFDGGARELEPAPENLIHLESAEACRIADELLAGGRDADARLEYLASLEMAPGLPEPLMTLASIDAAGNDGNELAWSSIEEAGQSDSMLGAELLEAMGRHELAREAWEQAAARESYGPLAAMALARAAELAPSAERELLLDRAVARAPRLARVRWARFAARLAASEFLQAEQDALHLEHSATTPEERLDVCLRVGRAFRDAGVAEAARRFLERGLRQAPEDPAVRGALGRVYAELGLTVRAVSLLQSALRLLEERSAVVPSASVGGEPAPSSADMILDLAHLLATSLGQFPQAIGRLRAIPARSSRAAEARVLEAEYCEKIHDHVGAARAYSRLRESVELGWTAGEFAVEGLRRAAAFAEREKADEEAERAWLALLKIHPLDEQAPAQMARLAKRRRAR